MYNLIIMSRKSGLDDRTVVHSEHSEQILTQGLQCEKRPQHSSIYK